MDIRFLLRKIYIVTLSCFLLVPSFVTGQPVPLDQNVEPSHSPNKTKTINQRCQVNGTSLDPSQETLGKYSTVFLFAIGLSCLCLLASLFIYGVTWTIHKVHGWTVMTLFFFSFMWYTAQGAIIMVHSIIIDHQEFWSRKTDYWVCWTCLKFFNDFSQLGAYCWVTIISFDLWHLICSNTPPSERSKGKRRFLVYSCLGLGIPFMVILIGILIHFWDQRSRWTNFGRDRNKPDLCHVDDYHVYEGDKAYGIYLMTIHVVIYCVNMIFVCLTVHFLCSRLRRDTGRVAGGGGDWNKDYGPWVRLFVKLILITKVTWGFEIIKWAVGDSSISLFVLIFFQLFHYIRPVIFSAIFVLRKDVKQKFVQTLISWWHPSI